MLMLSWRTSAPKMRIAPIVWLIVALDVIYRLAFRGRLRRLLGIDQGYPFG